MSATRTDLPPYGQPAAAQAPVDTPIWGARWIYPDDMVYNRQGFNEIEPGQKELQAWLNDPVPGSGANPIPLAMEEAKRLAGSMTWSSASYDCKLLYEDDRGVIYGVPNGSYGYVYVAAWLKPRQPLLLEALNFATGLSEHDPADPTRAGYTPENAVLAAAERFNLDADQSASVLRMLLQRTNDQEVNQ